MNERGKFREPQYELMRSLEQLSPDQQYFVIFFSDGAYPMDAEEPVDASQESRRAVERVGQRRRAERRHEPVAGTVAGT